MAIAIGYRDVYDIRIPKGVIESMDQKYNRVWKRLDKLRDKMSKNFFGKKRCNYDSSWCFLPKLAYPQLLELFKNYNELPPDKQSVHASVLEAVATWRLNQDVVIIDKDIQKLLYTTPINDIPCDILRRIPSWSIYIPIEIDNWTIDNGPIDVIGLFFFTSTILGNNGHSVRTIGIVPNIREPDMHLTHLSALHISVDAHSINEAIDIPFAAVYSDAVVKRCAAEHPKEYNYMKQWVIKCLPFLLYAITEHENLQEAQRKNKSASVKVISRSRAPISYGWHFIPPDKPHVLKLGFEIGDQLRKATAAEEEREVKEASATKDSLGDHHKRPRPHIRRAHWHTFWTGRRKFAEDETPVPQVARAKFLPVIPVALRDDDPDDDLAV